MTELSLQFLTIGEREPQNGEQVLLKHKSNEVRQGGVEWILARYEEFSGYGAVFVSSTMHISKEDVTHYAILPDI